MNENDEQLESPFLSEEVLSLPPAVPLASKDESDESERDEGESADGERADGESADGEGPSEDAALEAVDEAFTAEGEEESALWEALSTDDEAPSEENEADDLAPADTIDAAAAQTAFAPAVRDRVESLLDATRGRAAITWNTAQHPAQSGVAVTALLNRLGRYVSRPAIEKAMQDSAELRTLSSDPHALLAVMTHQFQQKIYASVSPKSAGMAGEGVLDALGFVRHRGASLNAVDAANVRFHVKGRTAAFRRIQDLYTSDSAAFAHLGADVSPKTWYCLFVNAPFLGRPFDRGIQVELMRRLRLAEKWLLAQPKYQGMSAAELGAALGIDEDHHGGRPSKGNSMHTLGLAVDISYIRNPWVSSQRGPTGKLNKTRNAGFQAVTRNVSRLLSGTEEVVTPGWLHSLSAQPSQTTTSAYQELMQRQRNLQAYLALEHDSAGLRAAIEKQRQGPRPQSVIKQAESVEAAAKRWRAAIESDRGKLQHAFGSKRSPGAGFLNFHHDLVVALRDHGCLAWGAIDLGANANGDMMHFDCRATGIGWKLSMPNQRTAAASHPCVSSRAAAEPLEEMEELERPPPVGSPTTAEPFADGRLWSFASRTLPLRVGVFCPKAVTTPKSIDVLVYAHGHLGPCPPVPKILPDDLLKKAPFALAKIVSASQRAIVLVVPVLDWGNLRTNGLAHEACNRPNMHRLGVPANLNGVLAEVLAEVGRVYGTLVPAIANLILSGHSRAFDFLNPLALAHADADMARGALAVLSEVWAFDTTYACYMAEWLRWLQSKPGLQMTVVYRKGSPTTACGEKFEKAAAKSGGRLRVIRASERHCDVPIVRLPALLNPSAAPSVGKGSKEVEEWVDEPGEIEAEFSDEEFGQSAAMLHEDRSEELSELEDADEAEQALAWELNAISDELEELETETVDPESQDHEADVEGEWDEAESAAVGGASPKRTCKDDRCTSAYIMWMQKSLNTVLRTSLPVSGRLDRATQTAIKKFKKTKRVKTKEAYAGAAIERALVAAGAQAPPPLAKVPCGVSQASELVPLLEKYRGDIPLALLLGWIQVEFGARPRLAHEHLRTRLLPAASRRISVARPRPRPRGNKRRLLRVWRHRAGQALSENDRHVEQDPRHCAR